ncbi:MAG: SprT family zinc-dependent metalloprotease [Methylococcaceae bacterium]
MSNSLPFHYQIKRSPKASRVRIVVSHNRVEVVAPLKVAELSVHQFVSAKQDWIQQALEKIAEKTNSKLAQDPKIYQAGAEILYRGLVQRLRVKASALKKISIEFDDTLTAYVPVALLATENSDAIKKALEQWLKKQAKHEVEQIVQRWVLEQAFKPNVVRIKAQKSRWGSCGIHNDININWLLIMAPPEVLEYVVVHELCHLKIRNHSKLFWQLVAKYLPAYQEQRLWLKKHGAELMQGI